MSLHESAEAKRARAARFAAEAKAGPPPAPKRSFAHPSERVTSTFTAEKLLDHCKRRLAAGEELSEAQVMFLFENGYDIDALKAEALAAPPPPTAGPRIYEEHRGSGRAGHAVVVAPQLSVTSSSSASSAASMRPRQVATPSTAAVAAGAGTAVSGAKRPRAAAPAASAAAPSSIDYLPSPHARPAPAVGGDGATGGTEPIAKRLRSTSTSSAHEAEAVAGASSSSSTGAAAAGADGDEDEDTAAASSAAPASAQTPAQRRQRIAKLQKRLEIIKRLVEASAASGKPLAEKQRLRVATKPAIVAELGSLQALEGRAGRAPAAAATTAAVAGGFAAAAPAGKKGKRVA